MNITKEQTRAAEKGEPVRIRADDMELVLVRADVYDRLAGLDDNPRAAYPAVLKALDRNDENADQYLEYFNGSK